MLKDYEMDGGLHSEAYRSTDERARGGGRVYCFVGTADLRRLLSLLAGTELLVSPAAIGATGLFAPLAGIAPKLVRTLYEMCRDQKLFEARRPQEELAALRQALKPAGVAGIKAAMRSMGRDCGEPRPPLLPLDPAAYQKLVGELDAIRALREEPRGWR